MCTAEHDLLNLAAFPMKQPEMQIGTPDAVTLPDVQEENEFARNTQTWD